MESTSGHVVTIAEGRLFALVHPYALDGREASHPLTDRGYTSMNCYLALEPDQAVLLGTGYSLHEQALIDQLETLLQDRPLVLVIPRIEFMSMCNARPLADRFNVSVVYQRLPLPPSLFLNFRPEFLSDQPDGLTDLRYEPMRVDEPLHVGRSTDRQIHFLMPELRLLPCNWAYDTATQTLFTGDLFSWIPRDSPAGPWLIKDEAADPTTSDVITTNLVHNRYWWLAGARTDTLRDSLTRLFQTFQVVNIAPDHGPILTGEAVSHHFSLLDSFLQGAPLLPPTGLDAAMWQTTATAR